MAVIMTPPPIPPGDPAAEAPPTLSITYYLQLAAHFSAVFDEMAVIIPRDLGVIHKSAFVRSHLNIPFKFLGTTVASVEQNAELRSVGKLDVDRARDTLQMIEAFLPICDKVAVLHEALKSALNARHAALAVEALEAYHVAQSLSRDESNPTLSAWVENMSRDLGRSGRKAQKKPAPGPVPPVDTVPAPVPVSTATWVPEKADGRNG
jgi:hypothetical protein